MNAIELEQHLLRLELSIVELSELLGFNVRTVKRWIEGEEVPRHVEQVIGAWIRLHERGLPWRPDFHAIDVRDQRQIELYLEQALSHDALLSRVEARGGPRLAPWVIDFERGRATFEPFQVSFNRHPNGSCSISYFTRKDIAPDVQRDLEIIEDAYYAILQETRRGSLGYGPVVLIAFNGSPRRATSAGSTPAESFRREFSSAGEAIRYASQSLDDPAFVDAYIRSVEGNVLLWDHIQLMRECRKRRDGASALKALADQIKTDSQFYVRDSPKVHGPDLVQQKIRLINQLADQLIDLGKRVSDGLADYSEFDKILGQLHAARFFPKGELVSDVAKAFVMGQKK